MTEELNKSSFEAFSRWKRSEPRDFGIFEEWCVIAINTIASNLKSPGARGQAILELTKNLESYYGISEPQEPAEERKNQNESEYTHVDLQKI